MNSYAPANHLAQSPDCENPDGHFYDWTSLHCPRRHLLHLKRLFEICFALMHNVMRTSGALETVNDEMIGGVHDGQTFQ